MPNRKGDLYISMPEPTLRQAIRRAAYETDQPIRRLVREILTKGLAEIGYPVEPAVASNPVQDAATINHERVSV